MGVAFYPGSFDPFHLGHLDIVEQAVGMFGELVIGVMHNPAKPSGMFTADERADLIRQSTTHLGKAVCVEKFSGLTVDAAASIKASFIVKSARTTSDFETEQQMALTNRAATGINTVLLLSSPEHQFITSTYIRQFAQHKGTMRTKVAPQCVLEALAKKNS